MFKQTVQHLLTGSIICETAYNEEFQYLKLAVELERVNDFLQNLDRKLTYLESADAYYCTFTKVDNSNTAELMTLFSDMRSTFRPLVEFLDLLLTASNADLPIHGKSMVNINELFEPFEQDQTLRDQLRRLTSIKPFKTNKEETREQLATLFNKLEEMHYFVRKNPGSSRFYATARFDIIYTLIEFLNDSERVELPDDPQVQQDELLF